MRDRIERYKECILFLNDQYEQDVIAARIALQHIAKYVEDRPTSPLSEIAEITQKALVNPPQSKHIERLWQTVNCVVSNHRKVKDELTNERTLVRTRERSLREISELRTSKYRLGAIRKSETEQSRKPSPDLKPSRNAPGLQRTRKRYLQPEGVG